MYFPPYYQASISVRPTFFRFKKEAMSWVAASKPEEGSDAYGYALAVPLPDFNPRSLRSASLESIIKNDSEGFQAEDVNERGYPLFEKVRDLYCLPSMEFMDKVLEFAATVGPLFYDGRVTLSSEDGGRACINLGSLEEWDNFVSSVCWITKNLKADPGSDLQGVTEMAINDLLRAYPSGHYLESSILVSQWSPCLASVVALQLANYSASIVASKGERPYYPTCALCGHQGPLECMTLADDFLGRLSLEAKTRLGLPPNGPYWFHNRDKDRKKIANKATIARQTMEAGEVPGCYGTIRSRYNRARKQNKAPNNQPVSPEK